ncbi:acyltransferase, putative [Citrifermentans bemidjiense Bem]|uniref:Acyltransferase, putative n=1 Tax=Citrifermentans bemidjiense (strain ATCC BAA-1014 / DSM 16622 / JCM 12645 / Bem) TaxID=404380 RepID=B5ECV3_CITBB|nr:acyltransferase [Citrifermentans bemidjiense]ACH40570.1 acyltransferase, putative [Citrifermentans bemidjiense Bem]
MESNKHVSIADKDVYFDYIDGLRGFAVLMVVAIHTSQGLGYYYDPDFGSWYTRLLWNSCGRGVDLFFILSAFTLFNSSHKRFAMDRRPVLYFYVRRAFRILPLWWGAITVFGPMRDRTMAAMVASALFYFGFMRYDANMEVVGGGWTLFVEETFYLLLPLIFAKITDLKSSLRFLFVLYCVMQLWTRGAAKIGVPETNAFIVMFPLSYWFCFAYGITIYFLLQNQNFTETIKSKARLLDMLAIFGMFTLFMRPLTLSTFALALFVVTASLPNTICGKITRNRLLMKYGTCCYSIYLFHALVFHSIHSYIPPILNACGLGTAPLTVKSVAAFVLMAAACLPFGLLSFRFIEKPAVQIGKRVINRMQALPDAKTVAAETA